MHIVHLVLTQVETVDERESWAIFALATASANQGGPISSHKVPTPTGNGWDISNEYVVDVV